MNARDLSRIGVGALAVFAAAPAAADVQYVYDSAGRLMKAIYSNGITIEYRYDAAGNRTQIVTTAVPNSPPVAVNDSATTGASAAVDIYVRANDSDPDGHPLTITSVGTPTGGSATILGAGTYVRYTAPATAGVKTFTYTISDGAGGTASATVTVTVTPNNQPPVAVNDSATTVASSAVDIYVRSNDSDPNGNPLTITGVGTPTGGSATILGGGAYIRYTAPASTGVKTFTYTISDGAGGTASATVSVTVTPNNQPPVAVNDSATTVASSAVDIYVRSNDSDPNGNPLTITGVGTPTGGSATILGAGTYVRYTAPASTGVKTFTYTISDGAGGTASATVSVTVTSNNQPPVAEDDYESLMANHAQAFMLLANDTDPNGDTLTIISVGNVTGGSVNIAPGGSYVTYYAPSTQGGQSFDYVVSDGRGGTDTGSVNVDVGCDFSGPEQCEVQ